MDLGLSFSHLRLGALVNSVASRVSVIFLVKFHQLESFRLDIFSTFHIYFHYSLLLMRQIFDPHICIFNTTILSNSLRMDR